MPTINTLAITRYGQISLGFNWILICMCKLFDHDLISVVIQSNDQQFVVIYFLPVVKTPNLFRICVCMFVYVCATDFEGLVCEPVHGWMISIEHAFPYSLTHSLTPLLAPSLSLSIWIRGCTHSYDWLHFTFDLEFACGDGFEMTRSQHSDILIYRTCNASRCFWFHGAEFTFVVHTNKTLARFFTPLATSDGSPTDCYRWKKI